MVVIRTNEFNSTMLESRDVFENYLYVLIKDHFEDRILSAIQIELPPTVTKVERYQIHKYSLVGKLQSVSRDEDDQRIITLKLTKRYVEDLFENFYVPVEDTTVKTDKELLLHALITFIEKNLYNEFMKFLDKY